MTRRPATAIALALALLSTVLLALVVVRVSDRHEVAAQRATILKRASAGVQAVLSYDYRHLDSDVAAADRLLTPSFRKEYDADMTNGVRPLAVQYHAVSAAQVIATGLVSASAHRAEVLAFVQQTVTNTKLTAPRLDRSRINVALVRRGGHWYVTKLTPI